MGYTRRVQTDARLEIRWRFQVGFQVKIKDKIACCFTTVPTFWHKGDLDLDSQTNLLYSRRRGIAASCPQTQKPPAPLPLHPNSIRVCRCSLHLDRGYYVSHLADSEGHVSRHLDPVFALDRQRMRRPYYSNLTC